MANKIWFELNLATLFGLIQRSISQMSQNTFAKSTKYNSIDLSQQSQFQIGSYALKRIVICAAKCVQNMLCQFYLWSSTQNQTCLLTYINALYYLSFSTNGSYTVYQRFNLNPNYIQTPGLTNYWPFYTNVNDVIGGANLLNGSNANFATSMSNKLMGSLWLNTSYMVAPPGVYFKSNYFTIASWVKPLSYPTVSLKLII